MKVLDFWWDSWHITTQHIILRIYRIVHCQTSQAGRVQNFDLSPAAKIWHHESTMAGKAIKVNDWAQEELSILSVREISLSPSHWDVACVCASYSRTQSPSQVSLCGQTSRRCAYILHSCKLLNASWLIPKCQVAFTKGVRCIHFYWARRDEASWLCVNKT